MLLNEVKLKFFLENVPNAKGKRVSQLEREYLIGQVGATQSGTHTDSLIQLWLKKLITTNGGTPKGIYISDLLKEALAVLSLPVTNYENSNWITLYVNL